MNEERRRYLGLLAGALAGTAGCLADGGDRTATDGGEPATDTPLETPTPTGSPTRTPDNGTHTVTGTGAPTGGRLVLDWIDETPTVPLTVYSPGLERVLRDAATTAGVVRATETTNPYNPQPVLPSFDAVELVDETGDAGGVYAVDAEGGTRHRMGLRAEEDPDATGSAMEVSSLSGERRDLVEAAITADGRRPGVFPETELGEWARENVFGHSFDYEGTRYRIAEIHATDAAFFSTTVWYILSLTPTDPADVSDVVTLRLGEIPAAVRGVLDSVVDWEYRRPPDQVTEEYEWTPESLAAFAAKTDGILTHTAAMTLAFER